MGTGDGKGKGWLAVGRMSLKRLRFLDSHRTPSVGASGRKLNDINVPSAIRPNAGFGIAFCTREWYIEARRGAMDDRVVSYELVARRLLRRGHAVAGHLA